eukprot:15349817-Ditylum_brightwellii.AAC.1
MYNSTSYWYVWRTTALCVAASRSSNKRSDGALGVWHGIFARWSTVRKNPAQSPGAKAGCLLGVFGGGAVGLE